MRRYPPVPLFIVTQFLIAMAVSQSTVDFVAAQSTDTGLSPSGVAIPVIPDGPSTVDPSLLMPAPLGKLSKVKFDHSAIEEILAWVGSSTGYPVILDQDQHSSRNRSEGIYVTDSLDNEPVFWLLNRLSLHGLNWHFEDDIIHVVPDEGEALSVTTKSYNLAELLDNGFTGQEILGTMEQTICPDGWQNAGGISTYSQLGDVLFVKTTYHAHLELQGLLKAIRNHGRRTWAYDPPQHEKIREKLNAKISVRFDNVPLHKAIEDVARRSELDIRIDFIRLEAASANSRIPVNWLGGGISPSRSIESNIKRENCTTSM